MSETGRKQVVEASHAASAWHLWVDTGGTFTDCVAKSPDGELRRAKVLSNSSVRGVIACCLAPRIFRVEGHWHLPDGFFRGAALQLLGQQSAPVSILDYRATDRLIELSRELESPATEGDAFEIVADVEAPVLAAHWVTGRPLTEPLPLVKMRLATTRGTNALLERRGSATALFTTRGFGDLLLIGNQQRPDLFALAVEKPPPLYEAVVEVEERLSAQGEVLNPLNLDELKEPVVALLQRGIDVAAVALLHSYRNPGHERTLAGYLRKSGFRHVSCSSELASRIKIVPRAETAVVNAYLADVIGGYLQRVRKAGGGGPLHVLTSAGGLVRDGEYLPKDSLLSGPAGGVVGAAAAAIQSGFHRSLAFDMGGTSTDISRFDGEFDYEFETRVGDAHLLAPCLAIETVAAGGGSICHFDGRQLKVGPHSAGASPGPACYGAGGPLTLTDVNLLLGRLDVDSFEIPIDPEAARRAAHGLLSELHEAGQQDVGIESLLQGLLEIANERMAEAVRRISIRRGYRPSDYALVAFGGAGGQHACALAEILGLATVLVPADAGILSALGLGRARIERLAERQVLEPLEETSAELPRIVDELTHEAHAAVADEGVSSEDIETHHRSVFLRLLGQESTLTVDYDIDRPLAEAFVSIYEDHFGYRPQEARIEVESIRVLAASRQELAAPVPIVAETRRATPVGKRQAHLDGVWQEASVFRRSGLRPGDSMSGPALVFERHSATVVAGSWLGRIDGAGCLILERRAVDRRADDGSRDR